MFDDYIEEDCFFEEENLRKQYLEDMEIVKSEYFSNIYEEYPNEYSDELKKHQP